LVIYPQAIRALIRSSGVAGPEGEHSRAESIENPGDTDLHGSSPLLVRIELVERKLKGVAKTKRGLMSPDGGKTSLKKNNLPRPHLW